MSTFKNNVSKSTKLRSDRMVSLFDEFRKNVWVDARSPYKNLKTIYPHLILFKWLITVTLSIRIITVAAFIRVLRPALTLKSLRNGSFEYIDMVLDDGENPNLYYKEQAFDTIKSALFGGLNRLVRVERDNFRIRNVNKRVLPKWIDSYKYLTVGDNDQTILSDLCDILKKKCFTLRGGPTAKSKAMSSKDFETIQSNIINQYYPKFKRHFGIPFKWDPQSLNLAMMGRIAGIFCIVYIICIFCLCFCIVYKFGLFCIFVYLYILLYIVFV